MDSINVRVAKRLLEIKAVFLRPQEPFTWASSWGFPVRGWVRPTAFSKPNCHRTCCGNPWPGSKPSSTPKFFPPIPLPFSPPAPDRFHMKHFPQPGENLWGKPRPLAFFA